MANDLVFPFVGIYVAMCLVPAWIASRKGNSGIVAFVYSVVLSPFAGLIVAILWRSRRKVR